MSVRAWICAWVAASIVVAAAPAFAQGRRPGVPPGQAKKGQQSSAATSSSASLGSAEADIASGFESGRVRSLGAWLDDATVLPSGNVWLALSASRWSLPIASGSDAPVVDVSVGITDRVQASVSLPYFLAMPSVGDSIRGMGDIYVATKVVLRDASDNRIGIAVAPAMELLSRTSVEGTTLRRANVVLPVNIERRLSIGRVYGSSGIFSRGAFFMSGAVEHYVNNALSVSGAVTHSYATDAEALSEELGLGRRRVDLSGTAVYTVSPQMALFGSLGRTIWGRDADSTRFVASGGVSVKVR